MLINDFGLILEIIFLAQMWRGKVKKRDRCEQAKCVAELLIDRPKRGREGPRG